MATAAKWLRYSDYVHVAVLPSVTAHAQEDGWTVITQRKHPSNPDRGAVFVKEGSNTK